MSLAIFKGQRKEEKTEWNSKTGNWKAGEFNTTKVKKRAFQEGGGRSTAML